MMKMSNGGKFPVEMIGKALVNSRVGKWMTVKVRMMIEQTEARQLRVLCIVLITAMLTADTIILLRPGSLSRAAPAYSVMRSVRTEGMRSRPPEGKGFGPVWDSLMAEPETKGRWDSLLRVRPGLKDTVRWLERMDSAAGNR
ncbi:MAG TPA: hypothetical protein VGM30_19575 [Puia sp.]